MEKIILYKEFQQAEKDREQIIKARNKASALINDAKARYIKEKTRARSKKAAIVKDGILKSARFDALSEYERFEDIQEAYGYDIIDEKERDRLEALWIERQNIQNKTEDGIYQDDVTKTLDAAWIFLQDYREDEVQKLESVGIEFKRQREEADREASEWLNRQNAEYLKLQDEGTIP